MDILNTNCIMGVQAVTWRSYAVLYFSCWQWGVLVLVCVGNTKAYTDTVRVSGLTSDHKIKLIAGVQHFNQGV